MFFLKIFNFLFKLINIIYRPLTKKNIKYKNIHTGETCHIILNGGSIKFCNFSRLPNTKVIATNLSLLDVRIKEINIDYYVIPGSFIFYPLHRVKRNKNYPAIIYKKFINKYKKVIFFIDATNFFSFLFQSKKNINFFHYFDNKDGINYDLANKFEVSRSAIESAIGMAKYMNFKKIVILGADYLGSPKYENHFYSKSERFIGKEDKFYKEKIKNALNNIEALLVFPEGVTSDDFNYVSIKEYFGTVEDYKDWNYIIDNEYIEDLENANKTNQIYFN